MFGFKWLVLPLPTANKINPLEHLLQINKRKDPRKDGTGRAAEGHTVAISRGSHLAFTEMGHYYPQGRANSSKATWILITSEDLCSQSLY